MALALFASAARADSWEDERKAWEELSGTRFYKDPGYAAKLALNFFPVDNGHFYVGEVGKGIWFSVGETASLAAVAVPLLGSQSRSRQDLRPVWTDAMVSAAAFGGFAYVALKVWSGYSAAADARKFNAAHEKRQSFRLDLAPGGVRLTKLWR